MHVFLSADSVTLDDDQEAVAVNGVARETLYPIEFLIMLKSSGVANHKIQLKVGGPVILLRNLKQSIGLCNGTRLIVVRLGNRVVEAEILTGNKVGKRVFIPRVKRIQNSGCTRQQHVQERCLAQNIVLRLKPALIHCKAHHGPTACAEASVRLVPRSIPPTHGCSVLTMQRRGRIGWPLPGRQ